MPHATMVDGNHTEGRMSFIMMLEGISAAT